MPDPDESKRPARNYFLVELRGCLPSTESCAESYWPMPKAEMDILVDSRSMTHRVPIGEENSKGVRVRSATIKTVLLVEDHSALRELLTSALSIWGIAY